MLSALVTLAALAGVPAKPLAPAHVGTELTSEGPGLAMRVTSSTSRIVQRGLTLRLAPVYVGWELREGASPLPSRFGVAALGITYGNWLEARALALEEVDSVRLRTMSRYVHPFALTLRRGLAVAPGLLDVAARLDLTFSLWQATQEEGAPFVPLLPCSSGSIGQATVEATIRHELSVGLVAGLSDDPVHFDDGADCIGGGDVWRSSSWVGARASAKLDRTWSLIVEAGRSFESLHHVLELGDEHAGHTHEHVALRSAGGVEAGAWLGAGF
ncbi:MAG TPA: hypothetical protein VNN72_27315 [Polyangiaceae bacterium]|nr:hypothetical protein [Polyangiaceae bacterium]